DSRTVATATATRNTITNPTPDTPSQANSGEIGLADCDSEILPQAKPPYGHTLEIASRAVQRPAMTTGTASIRPSGPRTARGSTRVAIEMSMVPSPHHSAMRTLRATQGTAR